MSRQRCTTSLLVSLIALLTSSTAFAQRAPEPGQRPESVIPPVVEERPGPIPPETNSTTDHELLLNGKTIRYGATAGTLLIDGEDEKPYGSVFYVAYMLRGVNDLRTRPVTFLYNGGPGSASVWLHMGRLRITGTK